MSDALYRLLEKGDEEEAQQLWRSRGTLDYLAYRDKGGRNALMFPMHKRASLWLIIEMLALGGVGGEEDEAAEVLSRRDRFQWNLLHYAAYSLRIDELAVIVTYFVIFRPALVEELSAGTSDERNLFILC